MVGGGASARLYVCDIRANKAWLRPGFICPGNSNGARKRSDASWEMFGRSYQEMLLVLACYCVSLRALQIFLFKVAGEKGKNYRSSASAELKFLLSKCRLLMT